ncbi:unnamed protein product, partial [Scytosiphon promiscuus]
ADRRRESRDRRIAQADEGYPRRRPQGLKRRIHSGERAPSSGCTGEPVFPTVGEACSTARISLNR